jgi:hypothetical protein
MIHLAQLTILRRTYSCGILGTAALFYRPSSKILQGFTNCAEESIDHVGLLRHHQLAAQYCLYSAFPYAFADLTSSIVIVHSLLKIQSRHATIYLTILSLCSKTNTPSNDPYPRHNASTSYMQPINILLKDLNSNDNNQLAPERQ